MTNRQLMKLDRSKTILVSHPRSGLNWLRYCIEYFSGRPTPGRTKLKKGGDPAIYRTHDVRKANTPDSCNCIFYEESRFNRVIREVLWRCGYRFTPIFPRMVLVVRDYHDNAARESTWRLSRYAVNIRAYDAFEGEKMILYYEDFKDDFSQVERLLDFLDINHDAPFDIDEHRAKSLEWYDTKGIGLSVKPTALNDRQRAALQANLRYRIGPCMDTLLGRYAD
ncbi:MAG: hypothetical protein P8L37_00450 [Phycisphaerales bacterium]|nr:hypothetical protein [Phycisphaerales bacterium]